MSRVGRSLGEKTEEVVEECKENHDRLNKIRSQARQRHEDPKGSVEGYPDFENELYRAEDLIEQVDELLQLVH